MEFQASLAYTGWLCSEGLQLVAALLVAHSAPIAQCQNTLLTTVCL